MVGGNANGADVLGIGGRLIQNVTLGWETCRYSECTGWTGVRFCKGEGRKGWRGEYLGELGTGGDERGFHKGVTYKIETIPGS